MRGPKPKVTTKNNSTYCMLRMVSGLSQIEIKEMTRIPQPRLSMYENGLIMTDEHSIRILIALRGHINKIAKQPHFDKELYRIIVQIVPSDLSEPWSDIQTKYGG